METLKKVKVFESIEDKILGYLMKETENEENISMEDVKNTIGILKFDKLKN